MERLKEKYGKLKIRKQELSLEVQKHCVSKIFMILLVKNCDTDFFHQIPDNSTHNLFSIM